jgi:hypothetical protein
MLAVGGCAARLPNEPGPNRTVPPAPPYGLLVGVVAVVQTPTSPAGTYTASYMSMGFRKANGKPSELTLVARNTWGDGEDLLGIPMVEDGTPVVLRPFALRLEGGGGEFVAFNISRDRPAQRLTIDWKTHHPTGQRIMDARMVDSTESYLDPSPMAPASFDVGPGKVRYVGRIGAVVDGSPGGCTPIGFSMTRLCIQGAAFIGWAPDVDLPLIRQRFPNLAGVEIERQRLAMPSGSWPTLVEAMQRFRKGP